MNWFTTWGYIGGGLFVVILMTFLMITEPEGFHPRVIVGCLVAFWLVIRGIKNLRKQKGEQDGSITTGS